MRPVSMRLFVCLAILFAACFEFTVLADAENETQDATPETKLSALSFSEHVKDRYLQFLHQYILAIKDPSETADDRVKIAENPSYRRTRTIQYMYDYIEAATKELYAEQYAADEKYRRVECGHVYDQTVSEYMQNFTHAVQLALNDAEDPQRLYHSRMKAFVKKEIITQDTHAGLPDTVGEKGVFATQLIPQFTVLDHYLGDEYEHGEYLAQFVEYEDESHPFRRKFHYWMTVPFSDLLDTRLALHDLLIDVALDLYFAYDHETYCLSDEEEDGNLGNLSALKELYAPFMNDARSDMEDEGLNEDASARRNVAYAVCLVDGVPQTFVLSTRDIPTNEQVFVYYGSDPYIEDDESE